MSSIRGFHSYITVRLYCIPPSALMWFTTNLLSQEIGSGSALDREAERQFSFLYNHQLHRSSSCHPGEPQTLAPVPLEVSVSPVALHKMLLSGNSQHLMATAGNRLDELLVCSSMGALMFRMELSGLKPCSGVGIHDR